MLIEIYPKFKEFEVLLDLYPPQLANKYLPEWYKKQKIYSRDIVPGVKDTKNCPAIQDFLTNGIVIPAWTNIYLEKRKDGLHWHVTLGDNDALNDPKFRMLEFQSDLQMTGMDLNILTGAGALKLITPYLFKTPPGYSTQFTDPFYHHRRSIRALPGISQTDIWHGTNLVFEFLEDINLVEEKDLLIKAGEPLVMIQPHKRTNSKLEVNKFTEDVIDEQERNNKHLLSVGGDWVRYKSEKNNNDRL